MRFGSRVLVGTDGPIPAGLAPIGGEGDERLIAFMPKLRQLFRYKEYGSLARFRAEVPVGTLQSWPIAGERKLELLPESVSGDTVRMRVKLIRGTVTEVSRVPTEPTNLDPGLGIEEPVFRIRVRIDELAPRVPIDRRTLRPGMTLTANLVLENRSLWQVLFGPILGTVRQ